MSRQKSPPVGMSSDETLQEFFRRAARALRGTGVKLTRARIAEQTAHYVSEKPPTLLKKLRAMSDEEFKEIVAPRAVAGMGQISVPVRTTRPVRNDLFNIGRKR